MADALADSLAKDDPEAALLWRPDHPLALTVLAERSLLDSDLDAADAEARRALLSDPFQAGSLRTLGIIAARREERPRAEKFISLTARLTRRDVPTHLWLMERSAQLGQWPRAIRYCDLLLRAAPEQKRRLMAFLVRAAEQPGAVPALAAVMAADPPWRSEFLRELGVRSQDPATPFIVLAALQEGPAPPTSLEAGAYVNRMVRDRAYAQAYLAWSQFLTPDDMRLLGEPFDGDFEGGDTSPPFNWQFHKAPDVLADIAPRPGDRGERALRLILQGDKAPEAIVSQLLVLAPGPHRFSGETRAEALTTLGGLSWSIRCADRRTPLAVTEPVSRSGDWRRFGVDFVVPQDCPAQWLRLQGADDAAVVGEVWFDRLAVTH